MVPVMYQAYPGGPQQVYYVPAQGTQPRAGLGFMESIRSRIRDLASTDKLEGFSLGQTFSETFSHHGAEEVEEYMMVGSSRTTPPIELVQTGWPKPWMFFRLLMTFVIAAVALYFVWDFMVLEGQNMIPPIMIMGAFAMPLATLVFLFEMNTPRNVSVVEVAKLFVIGGVAGVCMAMLEYQIKAISNLPGPVEETAKLAAVLLVARSVRYKYQLNGILFGAAVGAGFACFETCGYALSSGFNLAVISELLKGQIDLANAMQAAQQAASQAAQQAVQQALAEIQQAWKDLMGAMVNELLTRGVLAPFGHVVWTAIAAGAFWRVKQDKATSFAMLLDKHFLMAFAIPVILHTIWDSPLAFGSNSKLSYLSGAVLGVVAWYVLFTMIQQGLRQVREMQKAQLQSTLLNVEATLGLGVKRSQIPVTATVPSSGTTPA
jgi:protease PrsW